jgi:CDP-diglyceride synthetase
MKQWHIEVAVFVLAAAAAFSFAYFLAQTVGLHPLIVPPAAVRQKDWMVAAGGLVFVIAVDSLVLFLIALKRRRERQAMAVDHGPALMR